MTPQSPYPRNMGPVDAMFWRLEQERSLRSTTMAVALLDSAPDRKRLGSAVNRACLRIPRLRQRVLELPAALSTPVWRSDPDFDIDYHLRWIAAPGAGELQPLLDLAASMAMRGFDRSRPLWEFVVVEGLADGRAALIQKLHHAVGDGQAGLALLAEIYDTERNPVRDERADVRLEPEPEEDESELRTEAIRTAFVERSRAARQMARDAISALGDPVTSVRRAFDELRSVGGIMSSGPGPFSPIMAGRSSRNRFATFRVDDERLKVVADVHHCKFNDAFLSALIGGLGLYHQRRNAPVNALRAAIPVSVRSADGSAAAGNRLAIAQFEAPLTEQDPGRRMRKVRSLLREQREPASLAAFEVIANMVNLLPTPFILPLVLEEMRKSDFVATAMVGPSAPFYVAGSRVESLIPFGPTAGAALNVTLLSYGGHASIGVTTDAVAVPDRDLLVECLNKGFDEVLNLGGRGIR
jgi:diacylglycerol O-acyltransferase